ncbi:MAG TPA: hypothetical protein VJ841_00675 [Candidatus Saccharimonadales bacterium]|nr:hypothetical protein [Candidatus Saccharimonadales bacterium]
MSYNRVLNSYPEYKQALIEALVHASEFPSYEDTTKQVSLQAAEEAHDPLLALFTQREFNDVETIMELQYRRFGRIDEGLFWSALAYVSAHVEAAPSDELHALFAKASLHTSHIPEDHVFRQWHDVHMEYFAEPIAYISSFLSKEARQYSNDELCIVLNQVLVWNGLAKRGWVALPNPRTNFISIARGKRQIFVGPSNVRLGPKRLTGLLLHEVYIHALWKEYYKDHDTNTEEGIGTLVEQLTLSNFHPLRMYRFLAICLAVGVDGTKRSMREVYELLVEMRQKLHPQEAVGSARLFVAKEVVRVFRNLPPEVPGFVYIRDKIYLEHSSDIWSKLTADVASRERYAQLVAPWEEKI